MPKRISLSPVLEEKLLSAKKVVILSGAGVSAESGISTFRDKDGLWEKFKPEDLATPSAFERNPKMVWEWYAYRRKKIQSVKPNPAHVAIAQMEKFFSEFLLVTQNVDNLHQKAGSRKLLELHGNIKRNKCFACEKISSNSKSDSKTVPPLCPCGGYLRPDVVWFGELLPEGALESAQRASLEAEVFFSVGTSAIVYPAASLPFLAKEAGGFVVEINMEETEITPAVDEMLLGKAGEILPGIVEFFKTERKKMKELTHLPEKIQQGLKNFVEDLKNLYSDQLVSVILYGSATGDDFISGRSDINTLVILKKVDFDSLRKYQARQKKYEKLGIVAPLFLEPEYIQSSADSFPIEFLDIKNQNKVLYGEDFFSGLEIHLTHLRLQCEQEIKGKLIRLRQHFLEAGNSREKLERLLSSSLASFIPVWRNMLRLKNKNQIHGTEEILTQIEKEFGFSGEVFKKIWKLKKNELKLKLPELQSLFADYLERVLELALKVDKI